MKKIVITGGLGYLGTELCHLYSGETRYKKIVVTDQRFVSERVKQLREWGFDFRQGNIMDKDFMSDVLRDADVVHHLAGITDVAYTKNEENKNHEEVFRVGVEGSRNVINLSPKSCKIIFPSTHVVYEAIAKDSQVREISEETDVCPELIYSKSKAKTEIDLQESDKEYVILRLASVYGYSTDTMRMGIMPNLFSKIASQSGTIKLFSGGVQLKSLVPLVDVVRCFKFMAESEISREIFHLSKENMTVKQVAELCKEFSPDLSLVETDDEIPNFGYTISNKKLLESGFEFRHSLRESIQEMISKWSKKEINPDLEYIIKGDKEYIDDRGKISNYELPEPINLIGYIESKKGSVRANHYHPIQEQKCLLIKGKYVSVIKDLANPRAHIETRVINEGDIAVIKPNVAHTMVFLEDSIFLNLVRGEREHENYGVTHTIFYELVDEDFRNSIMENYSDTCRVSGSKKMLPVVSLGMSPLANNLLESEEAEEKLYPLEMMYCPDSHNCQLSYVVPAGEMFDHYLYVSSTTKSLRSHFETAAQKYIDKFDLGADSLVVDIGSNDGVSLAPLKLSGVNVVGVEPASNIAEIANKKGVNTLNEYFTEKSANNIAKEYGKADLVTASNVFAHADGLAEITKAAFSLLKVSGTFIVEVQYLLDTMKDLTFDNIYHEHVNYWSVTSIKDFFDRLGYTVSEVENIDTHGGSIRVYVQRDKGKTSSKSVEKFLREELDYGITEYKTYRSFSRRIEAARRNVVENIELLKQKGYKLIGYGSPAKATTSLNYYGITQKEIDYIVDDNPLKHGKYIPGVKIPIYSRERIQEDFPDVIVVMAWNYIEEIKNNNKDLLEMGVKFISIRDLQEKNITKTL